VGAEVQASLKTLGMRMYRYDEDAAEAAMSINNELKGAITAKPATPGVITIEPDNRIVFQISNPNCVDAKVTALTLTAARSQTLEITPITLSGAMKEVRVDVDKLSSVWNQDTTVTPVIAPGTSLSTEVSSPFWMGDWIRVRRLTPHLYPRDLREGQTLVDATLERSLRAPAGLTVSGIDAGSRSRLFQLPEGSGENLYVLPFDLNEALANRLGGTATANVGTTGIRLLLDEATAVANAALPLTSPTSSDGARYIEWIATAALSFYLVLIGIMIFKTFSQHEDVEGRGQVAYLLSHVRKVAPGIFSSVLLAGTRFRSPLIPDTQMWLLVGWRAVAAGLSVFFLLRGYLVQIAWSQTIETRLMPADRAVRSRRTANAAMYMIAVMLALWIIYAFFIGPASHPPPGAAVLKGVTR
jgi:hypothetical protein